jgi:Tat protein secretion system quality control protein TatD with DNase activity
MKTNTPDNVILLKFEEYVQHPEDTIKSIIGECGLEQRWDKIQYEKTEHPKKDNKQQKHIKQLICKWMNKNVDYWKNVYDTLGYEYDFLIVETETV